MRTSESEVARILGLIATEPGRRTAPMDGDLSGTHDYWFDGGAVTMLTSTIRYHFDDGVTAYRDISPFTLSVKIVFKDGSKVTVVQS